MDIADKRIATVAFTLTDDSGTRITTTDGHAPLTYMHGQGTIAAGLEDALLGRSEGDRFSVSVPPEKGFGPRHPELVQTVPRKLWTAERAPEPGDRLQVETARGPLDVVVTAVDDATVTVDGNHPLAGRTFHAEIEVLSVRVPTPQELQFGLG